MTLEEVQQELRRVPHPDGTIVRAELIQGQAIVIFNDYRARPWRFRFDGVVLFRAYEHGGDVEEIRAATNSEARDEAIAAIERDGGAESGYPDLLTVYFVTDNPVLTVVFQTLEVMQMVEG